MTPERARQVLGISGDEDAAGVQRAYRRKALECHPDRASGEEQVEYFTRRFMEVRDAYAALKEAGFPALPAPQEVVPDPPQVRSYERRFKKAEGEDEFDVSWREKLGYGPGPSVEQWIFWGLALPAAVAGMYLSVRWLLGVLRGDAAP